MSTPLWRQVIEGTFDPFSSSFDRRRSSGGSFEGLDTDWRAYRLEQDAARAAETDLRRQDREALELRGQEYVNLNQSQGRLESAVGVAEALGQPGIQPKGPPPALEGIANVLDAAKSAVVGGLSGLMGWDIEGETADQTKFAVSRFTRQDDIVGDRNRLEVAWERALKGLFGGQSYGFGDFEVLRYEQDDPRYQRVTKGLGAFALDVAFDPLTYYSFGSSILGRVVASTGVRTASRRVAQEVLKEAGDDVIRQQVERLSGRELVARVSAATGRNAEELIIRTPQQLVDDLFAVKGDHFLNAAADSWSFGNAAAYGARGRTGLYDRLVETVGSDLADGVWAKLPPDLRGGARFRVPFKRDVDEFTGMRVPSVISMPGSNPGRGFDLIGMDKVVQRMNEARLVLRTGPFKFLEHVSGGRGRSWTNVLNAARKGDAEAIEAYAIHFSSMAFSDQYRIFTAMLDQAANAGFQAIKRQLDAAAQRGLGADEIKDFASQAYFMRGRPDMPLPSAPEHVVAMDMVAHLFEMTDNVHRVAVEIYGDDAANKLRDYATRMLTSDGFQDLADRYGRLEGGQSRLAAGAGRLNSSFPKSMDIDSNGNLIVTAWMTPDEIFQTTGRELFIDDPFEAVAEYLNMMRRELSRDWAMKQLQDMGLLVSIGEDVLRQPTVRKIQSEVQTRMVKVRDMINRLEKGERIPEVMESQLEAERAGLETTLRAAELVEVEPGFFRSTDGLVEVRRDRSGGWMASVEGEPVPRPTVEQTQLEGIALSDGPTYSTDVPFDAPPSPGFRQMSPTWEPWLASGSDADVEYVHKILLNRIAIHEAGGSSVNRRSYLAFKRDLELLEGMHPRLRGMVYDHTAVPASSVSPNAKYRIEIGPTGNWMIVENVPTTAQISGISDRIVTLTDGTRYEIAKDPNVPDTWTAATLDIGTGMPVVIARGGSRDEVIADLISRFGQVGTEGVSSPSVRAALRAGTAAPGVREIDPSATIVERRSIDLRNDELTLSDGRQIFVKRSGNEFVGNVGGMPEPIARASSKRGVQTKIAQLGREGKLISPDEQFSIDQGLLRVRGQKTVDTTIEPAALEGVPSLKTQEDFLEELEGVELSWSKSGRNHVAYYDGFEITISTAPKDSQEKYVIQVVAPDGMSHSNTVYTNLKNAKGLVVRFHLTPEMERFSLRSRDSAIREAIGASGTWPGLFVVDNSFIKYSSSTRVAAVDFGDSSSLDLVWNGNNWVASRTINNLGFGERPFFGSSDWGEFTEELDGLYPGIGRVLDEQLPGRPVGNPGGTVSFSSAASAPVVRRTVEEVIQAIEANPVSKWEKFGSGPSQRHMTYWSDENGLWSISLSPAEGTTKIGKNTRWKISINPPGGSNIEGTFTGSTAAAREFAVGSLLPESVSRWSPRGLGPRASLMPEVRARVEEFLDFLARTFEDAELDGGAGLTYAEATLEKSSFLRKAIKSIGEELARSAEDGDQASFAAAVEALESIDLANRARLSDLFRRTENFDLIEDEVERVYRLSQATLDLLEDKSMEFFEHPEVFVLYERYRQATTVAGKRWSTDGPHYFEPVPEVAGVYRTTRAIIDSITERIQAGQPPEVWIDDLRVAIGNAIDIGDTDPLSGYASLWWMGPRNINSLFVEYIKAAGSIIESGEMIDVLRRASATIGSEVSAPPAAGARTIPGEWASRTDAAEVPTEWVQQFVEFDRAARPFSGTSLENLRQSIIDEGFRDPLILEIGLNGQASLVEGNHRLAIALELGLENVPVRAVVVTNVDDAARRSGRPSTSVTVSPDVDSGWYVTPYEGIIGVPPAIQDTPNLQRIGIGPQAAPAPIQPGLKREFAGRYKYTLPDGDQLDIVQVRPEGKAQVWRVTDSEGIDLGDFARREDAVAFIEGRPAAPRRPTIAPEYRALVVEIRRAMSDLSDAEDKVMQILSPENVTNVGRGQLDQLMEEIAELNRFLLNSVELLAFDNAALARRLISSRPGGQSVERGLSSDLAALLSDVIEDVASRAPQPVQAAPARPRYFGPQRYFSFDETVLPDPENRLGFADRDEAAYWANRVANRVRDPKARVVRDEVWESNRAALVEKFRTDYEWLTAALSDGHLLRDQTAEDFDTWVERVITFLQGVDPSIDPFDNAVDKSRYSAAARAAGLEQFSTRDFDPVVAAIIKSNDLYGPEIIAETIKRHFALARDLDGAEQFYQNYWRPYYTASKSWMTQGRGYGYTARNIIGSMYNAWLADVRARHFNQSAAMLAARRKARDAANEILERRPVQEGETTVEAWERIFYGELKVALREGGNGFPAMSEKNSNYVVDAYRLFMERNYGGRTARSRTWGELLDRGTLDVPRYGTEGAGRRVSELYGGKYVDELTPAQKALNASVDNAWMRHVTRVNESSEDYLRFAAFLRGADTYGLDDGGFGAGTWVVGTQFDYADLSEFERRVMKNIIPFYTWTRRNVPLQIRSVWMEPGKVNKLLRFHEEVMKAWTGEDKENQASLPEWVRRRGGWMTSMSSPGQDPESILGKIFGLKEDPIAGFIESPLTDLGMLFNATLNPLQLMNSDEMINNLNPLLGKAAFELVTGRSYTSGRELDTDALAPRWAVPWAAVRGRRNEDGELVFSQKWAQFFRNILPPFAQAERLLAPMFGDERMRRRWLTTVGSQILATPLYTVDPNQQSFAINNYAQGINEALKDGILSFEDKRDVARRLIDMGYEPAQIAQLGLSELDPGALNFEELQRARRNVGTEEQISMFLDTLPPDVARMFIFRRGFRGMTGTEAVEAWENRKPINELGALFLPEVDSAFASWFNRMSESDKLGFVFRYGYGPFRGAEAVQQWSSRGGLPNRPPGLGSSDFLS